MKIFQFVILCTLVTNAFSMQRVESPLIGFKRSLPIRYLASHFHKTRTALGFADYKAHPNGALSFKNAGSILHKITSDTHAIPAVCAVHLENFKDGVLDLSVLPGISDCMEDSVCSLKVVANKNFLVKSLYGFCIFSHSAIDQIKANNKQKKALLSHVEFLLAKVYGESV